jgi:hypothetical protein
VSDQGQMAWIGRRSVLVAVLVVAAIVGWGIGSFVGNVSSEAPIGTPSGTALSTPSASASPWPSPSSPATAIASSPELESEPLPPATILDMSGTGDKVSNSFEVRSGWQVIWQTDGEQFAFAVRGDENLGTIVDQTGVSSGAISVAPAGNFHIEVTAKGPWSIKVLQGQN